MLGADMACSYHRAGKFRKNCARQCRARILRIRATPLSWRVKTQLLLRGAFPAALHAAGGGHCGSGVYSSLASDAGC